MMYKRQCYLFMTTDPVHIGTGGYRLGRVDNSIVREPGTRVPKIPGTSMHGVARRYAAQLYEDPSAAGADHSRVKDPSKNPVCFTFGYISKQDQQTHSEQTKPGVVNIFDAHILAFPVYSLAGPVWVTTGERLREAGFKILWEEPKDWPKGKVFLTWDYKGPLNLGWLMVEVIDKVYFETPKEWKNDKRWRGIASKLVLVQEALFSQIINSNLEVRTSVAIDQVTGAAKEGALFTYEAIPRATFLTAEVVVDNCQDWPLSENESKETLKGNPLPGGPWTDPLAVVEAGFRLIEWLGVGGMGTRGFGRMAIVGKPQVETFGGGG